MSTEPIAATAEATISIAVVRALVEAVEQAGTARADFLARARIETAALEAPDARWPRSTVSRLCGAALDATGDAAFGLHWVERMSERMFAPVSHLIAHCSSLRQGLEFLGQFFRLLSDEAPYELAEHGEHVTIRCEPFVGTVLATRRLEAEMMVGGFWKLVRTFNAQAHPERVSFAYPAPPYAAEYSRLFEGMQRFDQPFTGLVFDRAFLNAPAPHKDDDLRSALQELAERRLQRVTYNTPYSTRVREFLVREGVPHRTDMASVARALELSVRSLRRRLEDEGKPYNDILSEALASVAKQRLSDPRRTIQEVAYDMGFSDPSTFHRAFKRWTGTTPNAYREAVLKAGT